MPGYSVGIAPGAFVLELQIVDDLSWLWAWYFLDHAVCHVDFSEGRAAVVACGFFFGLYDDVWCFGFGSGGAFVAFGSAWKTFLAFCAVSVSCWVHSS